MLFNRRLRSRKDGRGRTNCIPFFPPTAQKATLRWCNSNARDVFALPEFSSVISNRAEWSRTDASSSSRKGRKLLSLKYGPQKPFRRGLGRYEASVVLSCPIETIISNKTTRNRIVLSFQDSPRKPLRRRPRKLFSGDDPVSPVFDATLELTPASTLLAEGVLAEHCDAVQIPHPQLILPSVLGMASS